MRAGFALPRDADRRSAGLRRNCLWGLWRNCIFTARGGVALTGAGRSVMRAGFALPRDAGRRPALLSRASRDGMWWGIHVGRAQRHERWFRAPARCRSETGVPWPSRRSARWGLGATAFSQQEVVCHFTLAGRSVMRAGFALPRDAGRRPALRFAVPDGLVGRSAVRGFAALWAAVPV